MRAVLPFRRSFLVAGLVVGLVAALTGCSGSSSTSTSSTATASATATAEPLTCVSAGSASKAVTVTGAFGKAPTVKFKKPLSTTATQKSVAIAGSGAKVTSGKSVSIAYTMLNARSGKKIAAAGYSGDSLTFAVESSSSYLRGLLLTAYCSKVGSRVVAVIPPGDAFGSSGQSTYGIKATDSIVLVIDVQRIVPTKANGTAKSLPSGYPKVTLASNGQPTVSIPSTKAPTSLKFALSKVGTGDTVKASDTVTVQYQGVIWRTGGVFDQSWGKTGPTSFKLSGVVKGFRLALVGQKVGSQVVAIIPPSYGYGSSGQSSAGIKGTDTMVFVVDILGTQHTN